MSVTIPPPQPDTLDETLPQSEADRARTADLSRADRSPPGAASGFDLVRPIGEGAYGSVWLAKERKTGRLAAVKFFSRRGQDWVLLGREVEKLAALDTSHQIVGLIDVGWDADPPYYAMEYLPNGSLAGHLAAGPLPPAEAVELAKGVLRGLIHAHGGGILHCDLKPANVLLDQDFRPRLCDFGQARLTEEDRPALGTLFYMAPEQADFKALPDVRWDVYALGALLYHMLTGRPPHRTAETERELAACDSTAGRLVAYRRLIRRRGAPTDHCDLPGVDKRLAEIVERCLAPDPAERYRNAQAVLDAFEARDRYRSRRPLVALGLIGPILLLGAMTPLFLTTMRNAEFTAKSNMVERALESDALAAQLLARSLKRELEERTDGLERVAADEDLRRAVETAAAGGWADRTALDGFLKSRRAQADERRRKLGLLPDTSWFLTDAEGIQRWRDPYSAKTHDYDFSWKDYFHGRGVEYDEHPGGENPPPPDLGPIESSHVSTVFRSDATRHNMVAITTPIRNEAGEVIAVLGRTQHLWELLEDYEQDGSADEAAAEDDEDGVKQRLTLIDRRNWQLVAHDWLTKEHAIGLSDDEMARLRIAREDAAELEARLAGAEADEAVRIDDYRDPVGQPGFAPEEYGGRWLAAVRPVAGTDWLAVVQERHAAAIAPAERMRSELLLYAVAALAVGGGLVVTFWYFVTQALTERSATGTRRRAAAAAVDGGPGTP
ncbi:MAG TPA: serine/threonine protein kinase [Planctomycetaceae bacterium]